MPIDLAPVAFFAYNRPEHTLRSLEALSQCGLAKESVLHIFCDGPKKQEDESRVARVLDVVRSREWCGEVYVEISKENKGLANSIVFGVSSLCEKYGKVIVLEDDLLVSPFFLKYMNDSLDIYRGEECVQQIAGYMFGGPLNSDSDALFLPFTSSWGWATWGRAWKHFDPDMKGYDVLKNDSRLRRRFNLDGSYNFYKMLENQREGRVDSWAIRWYLGVFMAGGLALYPARTLVENMGWDGSGIHCGVNSGKGEDRIDPGFSISAYPRDISVSPLYETVKHRLRKRLNAVDRVRCAFDGLFKAGL